MGNCCSLKAPVPEIKVQGPTPETSLSQNIVPTTFANVINGESTRVDLNPSSAFSIEDCQNSTLLLLSVTSQVTVDACVGCKIVIGPCSGSVFVRDCKDCDIICAGQQVRLKKCQNTKVNLFSSTSPVIEYCSNIEFTCFQYNYPGLGDQFKVAGLDVFHNEWYDIYDFTPKSEFIIKKGELKDSPVPLTLGKPGALEVPDATLVIVDASKLVGLKSFIYSKPVKTDLVPPGKEWYLLVSQEIKEGDYVSTDLKKDLAIL